MVLDLHIHSTVSDGTSHPEEVVLAAARGGLDVIALSDHDTVGGVARARATATDHPIEVIPALEVSASSEGVELHILGYFVDPDCPELLEHTARAFDLRAARLRQMVERLRDQGVEVSFEQVRAVAGSGGTLGRPHLARALVEAGYAETVPEAFDLYIGNSHPAYIPTRLLNPHDAIQLIHRSGGIAVWAHPPMRYLKAVLPILQSSGLDGIEVYRPRIPRHRILQLENVARKAGLLVSGGSDWHGPDDGVLGEFRVDASEVSDLVEAGGL